MAANFTQIAKIGSVLLWAISPAFAQPPATRDVTATLAPVPQPNVSTDNKPANVLSADEWQRVDVAVNRALDWLAKQQRPDGSFPTLDNGQPAVTSLCLMAFVAHGHTPTDKRFGQRLGRAIDFVISCQKPNGLVTLTGPDGPEISRNLDHEVGTCAAYNHAISSLTLSEMYGMCDAPRAKRIQGAINKSLVASLLMQHWPKDQARDRGGWRYIDDGGPNSEYDSDLSITGWELMFLRSARNAGFE